MYFLMTFLVNKEYFAKNVSALKENPFHVIDFNHVFTTLFDIYFQNSVYEKCHVCTFLCTLWPLTNKNIFQKNASANSSASKSLAHVIDLKFELCRVLKAFDLHDLLRKQISYHLRDLLKTSKIQCWLVVHVICIRQVCLGDTNYYLLNVHTISYNKQACIHFS